MLRSIRFVVVESVFICVVIGWSLSGPRDDTAGESVYLSRNQMDALIGGCNHRVCQNVCHNNGPCAMSCSDHANQGDYCKGGGPGGSNVYICVDESISSGDNHCEPADGEAHSCHPVFICKCDGDGDCRKETLNQGTDIHGSDNYCNEERCNYSG